MPCATHPTMFAVVIQEARRIRRLWRDRCSGLRQFQHFIQCSYLVMPGKWNPAVWQPHKTTEVAHVSWLTLLRE